MPVTPANAFICSCHGAAERKRKQDAFRRLAARKLLQLAADAVGESGSDALIDNVDTMREDSEAVIQWHRGAVPLGEGWDAIPPRHVSQYGRMIGRKAVDGEGRVGWLECTLLVRAQRLFLDQCVGPDDEGGTVNGTGPPWRTNASWHFPDKTEHLTRVGDGLLYIGQALLVHPEYLLVRAVDTFSSSETLNLWKVGDGIHADEVEHDQVGLHHWTDGVGLHVTLRKVEPTSQQRLHFFQANPSRSCSQCPIARP